MIQEDGQANEKPGRGGEQAGTAAPPRAFAQGTGLVLQTVGVGMFLSSCCVCSLSGMGDPVASRGEVFSLLQSDKPVDMSWRELSHDPGRAGLMLMVMFTTVGGLALATFGLGLQSEKPKAAWGAVVSIAMLLVIQVAAGVGLWVGESSLTTRVWHVMLSVILLCLLGFAWAAMKQVRANPPPVDMHVLPRGFDIETLKRRH